MEETTIIAGTAVAMDSSSFAGKSAASWPSIFAGAFVAASATVIFVALGSGIGFASTSPWSGHGVSVVTFAVSTAVWLIVTQWFAAALGGYIAGRLRTRWVGTHTHEVFFRDTAHGLITWAVATVLVAIVAAASVMSAAGAAGRAVADATTTGALMPYDVDKLFRSTSTSAGPAAAEARLEANHIVANAFASGSVPDGDRTYLAEQVAARTGASQSEAQARVDGLIAAVTQSQEKLKADADKAKKATAQASIYLALSMLIGAFIASVSAALGGRIRDQHV
ncbi:MAG TPA: hypothetical protein VGN99_05995 [Steroidobacteraceae bacterium]|nr:hypothetical protein [Steroidobacteraceae bacterium]